MPDFLSGGIIFSVGIVWLLHKFFLLHIIFTDAFDYDMCKDILAVVMDLCQYFRQKKLKGYAAVLSSSSSFCS